MKQTIKQLTLIPLVILGLIIGTSSCKKKEPAKAVITVEDIDGNRVVNANITISCTPISKTECKEGIEQEGTSNSSGKAEFEWDHSAIYGSDDVGFAVLKCEASDFYDSTYTEVVFETAGVPFVNAAGTDSVVDVTATLMRYGSVFIELQVDDVTKETIQLVK